jgi:hypothetical protein
VNSGCDFSLQSLPEDFKKIFAQTALQFKAGNFHSPGEILAAFYFSTLKMFPDLEPKRSSFHTDQDYIEKVYQKLESLLFAYRDHPEEFYPMDESTKARFVASIGQVIQNVQAKHVANVYARTIGGASHEFSAGDSRFQK